MQDTTNDYPTRQARRRRSTLERATRLFNAIALRELDRIEPEDDYPDEPALPFSRRPWALTLDPTGTSATIELAGDS